MKPKMRDDVGRAIDLLLDRSAVAAGKAPGASIYAAADGRIRECVAQVEKVLGVLENMPAADPPRDLVKRTLRFVEQPSARESRDAQPSAFNQPPVA